MSPGAAVITSIESLLIIRPSKLAAVYQATDNGLFWMMDYEEPLLIIFLFRFDKKGVLLYAILIILATYIFLYTSSTHFLQHLSSKVKQLVYVSHDLRKYI